MRRWLLVGAAAVVVVAAALGVALARLDDWLEANRAWLTTEVSDALGRPVAYERLSVSPWGVVTVAGVRVAEDAAWGDGDFLRCDRLTVRLRLLPLVVGQYRIARVTLEAPSVTLVRDANGWNVDTLGQRPRARRDRWGVRRVAASATDAKPRKPIPPPAALLVIATTEIEGGTVRVVDRRATPPRELLLRAVALEASDVGLRDPIGFTLDAALLEASTPNLRLRGTIGPVGNPPDPDALPVDVRAELTAVQLAALRQALPELDAQLPRDLVVEGPLALRLGARGTRAALAIESAIDATAARVTNGRLLDKAAGVPLRVESRGARRGDAIVVESAVIRLDEADATAHGTITPGDPPRVDLQVDTGRTSLERIRGLVPALREHELGGTFEAHLRAVGTADPEAPPALEGTVALDDVRVRPPDAPAGIAGLTTTIRFAGDTATLPQTQLRVGAGTVTASGMLRDFRAPSGDLRVEADVLPLADLGFPQEGTRPESLRGLVVDGQLADGGATARLVVHAAEATLRDAELRDLATTVRWQEPTATIESFTAKAFGGALSGTGTLDLTDRAAPAFAVAGTATGLVLAQLATLRGDGLPERVEGTLDASLDVRGVAGPPKVFRRSLVGTARLDARDGAVKDVNLLDGVVDGLGDLPVVGDLLGKRVREKRPALLSAGNTRFDRLTATARIADGAARTNDLLLLTPDYTVTMAGTIGLAGAVDANGTLTTGKGLTADILASLKEARFITNADGLIAVPFHVSGRLPDVKVQPDPSLLVKALQGGLLQHGIEQLLGGGGKKDEKGKKKDGLGRDAEKLLKGIFGR